MSRAADRVSRAEAIAVGREMFAHPHDRLTAEFDSDRHVWVVSAYSGGVLVDRLTVAEWRK